MIAQGKRRGLVGRVCRIIWVLACVVILAESIARPTGKLGDMQQAEFYGMMALSFPSCWVGAAIFLVGLKILGPPSDQLKWALAIWVPLFVVGYFQWFVLVPAALRWWWNRRNSAPDNVSVVPKN